MQLKLFLKTTGESWILNPSQEYTIGRDTSCTIPLTNFSTLSFQHIRLFFNQLVKQWCVEDLNSSNGTFIQNQRISSSIIQSTTEIILSHEVHFVATPDTIVETSAKKVNSFQKNEDVSDLLYIPPKTVAKVLLVLSALAALGIGIYKVLPSFESSHVKAQYARVMVKQLVESQSEHYQTNKKFTSNLNDFDRKYIGSKHHNVLMNTQGENQVVIIATPISKDVKVFSAGLFRRGETTYGIFCESMFLFQHAD